MPESQRYSLKLHLFNYEPDFNVVVFKLNIFNCGLSSRTFISIESLNKERDSQSIRRNALNR